MTILAAKRTIETYLGQLASDAPTPGGGSVAGVIAALAMALGRMTISLSEPTSELEAAEVLLREAMTNSIAGSDADERAYGGFIEATRLPKATAEEKASRRIAMQSALRDAAETPMQLAELVASMQATLKLVADRGNPHVASDAAIALILADAAIQSCLINVRVNLPSLKDADLAASLESRIQQLSKLHGPEK